jgi:bifunctional N-acetylglucosamine-1-phosphate-uridyltransferase/glucosamine-1-phosphate-acetyltransferase GlmU-like protein
MQDNHPYASVGSLIFAAGKGSRMEGFEGNKTLLPLEPGPSPFEGRSPILLNIIANLPPGPKAVVVNHRKEDIERATRALDITYILQPETNGTGGALLASRGFLERGNFETLLITVGDAPFVRLSTFTRLAAAATTNDLVILAFSPSDRKQYGLLDIREGSVKAIIEYKYWSRLEPAQKDSLRLANAGIYGAKRKSVLRFLPELESRPHKVVKKREGVEREIKEYFITDLVEIMCSEGASVGYVEAQEETEVMGIDDLAALQTAQRIFASGLYKVR